MPIQLQVSNPKDDRYAPTSVQIFESMIKGKVVRIVRTFDMTSPIPLVIIKFTDGSSVEVSEAYGKVYIQYRQKSTFQG